MDYTEAVGEARKLVKRSEHDQWRIAELTWQAVNHHGRTTRQWADDIGASQSTASRWARVWERYASHSDSERPAFADAVAEAAGMPLDRQERRENEAMSNLRKASPERKRQVARELLDDPEVANDPGVRARVTSEPSAERMAQQRDFEERQRQQRQARHGMRYMAASDNLGKIKKLARDTLSECQGVEFDAEERELLGDDIDQAIAALNLLKAGVVGSTDVNWDAELAKLGDLS